MLVMTSKILPGSATSRAHISRQGRREGALAGLGVAALFAAVGVPVLALAGGRLDELAWQVGGPTVATGMVTGFLLGPSAWVTAPAAHRRRLSLRMALLATAIGDLLVGFCLGAESAISNGRDAIGIVGEAVISGVAAWPLGILFFGVVALPITFCAGLVWYSVMARLAAGRRDGA